MKRFRLHGNTANWGALKVSALDTNEGEFVSLTPIPSDMKVSVRVVNNYYRVYDKQVRQILHGEISAEDTAEILRRTSAPKRPDFILYHDGVVVGFANLHHRHRLKTYKGNITFSVTFPAEVKARTNEEALEKFGEYARAAAEQIELGTAVYDGVEITDIVRD